jgi:hypothetical protein
VVLDQMWAAARPIVSPGILGPDYFREIAAIAKAAAKSIPPALAEVMLRHGLTPAR